MPSNDTLGDLMKRRDTLIVALWNTMFQIGDYYELEAWPEYDLDLWMKVVGHPAIQSRLEKR